MSRLEEYVQSLPEWKQIFEGKYRTELVTRISEILEEKGWNQSDLADVLDCSDAYISKLLSGNVNVTLKTVSKLESALEEEVMHISWSLASEHENEVYPEQEGNFVWSEESATFEKSPEGEWRDIKVHPGKSGADPKVVSPAQLQEMEVDRDESRSRECASLS